MEHDGRGSRYLQREIPHRAAGEIVYGGADPEGEVRAFIKFYCRRILPDIGYILEELRLHFLCFDLRRA